MARSQLFAAAQAAQKGTLLTASADIKFAAAQAAQKNTAKDYAFRLAFAAAQAAQKDALEALADEIEFAAAQAAQKDFLPTVAVADTFAAAQAAQKTTLQRAFPGREFAAAQAAQKTRTISTALRNCVLSKLPYAKAPHASQCTGIQRIFGGFFARRGRHRSPARAAGVVGASRTGVGRSPAPQASA